MTLQELWERAKADIQTSVSPSTFTMWIAPTEVSAIKEIEGNRAILTLLSPTLFHRNTLEQRYYAQIKDALDRVGGKSYELQFQIGQSIPSSQGGKQPINQKDEPYTISPLFSSNPQTQDGTGQDTYRRALQKARLREDYMFDTFAVSSSNEMAHAAAIAVSQNPGKAYNPLFLYGGVGVGKTHLMQAIGNNIIRRDAETVLYYTTGEQFTNDIVAAIQQKKTIQLKDRFRNYQVLLIDDIQFIAGKTTVQEEFFHTFNAILPAGGQIVMTSDRPPHEINPLEDRLRSRFEAGLIVDIQQPTFELRTAILLIKAKKLGLTISMDVAQLIASAVESTRKLEGVLAQIHSQHTLLHKDITLELAKNILGTTEQPSFPSHAIKPNEVLHAVCAQYRVSPALLKGKGRTQKLVLPRHIAMYILKHDLNVPYAEIGSFFGGRDHTTVMHAVEKIEREIGMDAEVETSVSAIKTSLSSFTS